MNSSSSDSTGSKTPSLANPILSADISRSASTQLSEKSPLNATPSLNLDNSELPPSPRKPSLTQSKTSLDARYSYRPPEPKTHTQTSKTHSLNPPGTKCTDSLLPSIGTSDSAKGSFGLEAQFKPQSVDSPHRLDERLSTTTPCHTGTTNAYVTVEQFNSAMTSILDKISQVMASPERQTTYAGLPPSPVRNTPMNYSPSKVSDTSPSPQRHISFPKTAFPQPEKFDGHPRNLRRFIGQVRDYIECTDYSQATHRTRTGLIGNLLTGTAQTWYQNLAESNHCSLHDSDLFLSFLVENFEDRNFIIRQNKLLYTIVQGKRSVRAYPSNSRISPNTLPSTKDFSSINSTMDSTQTSVVSSKTSPTVTASKISSKMQLQPKPVSHVIRSPKTLKDLSPHKPMGHLAYLAPITLVLKEEPPETTKKFPKLRFKLEHLDLPLSHANKRPHD